VNKINTKEFYKKVINKVIEDVKKLNVKVKYTCYIIKDENRKVDPASDIYVSLKHKTSDEANITCNIVKLTEDEFLREMCMLEFNEGKRAILQLPAPQNCIEAYENEVLSGGIIDVDHLTDRAYASICLGDLSKIPATPRGIVSLLYNELDSIAGKKMAVVGARSKTTGKYLVQMLINLGVTVSCYTSRSVIKQNEFHDCDAVISCVGRPRLIQRGHLGANKPILIDVGVSRVNGKIVGDFNEECRAIARYTPYIGGVGLITRGYLVRNVVDSYKEGKNGIN